ncbi:uncharacterized protein LOC113311627 [Papaver somniferum]|uniref:uncharacterized protein LOC113311627 n=1 Tax=Papaver somniferum TaxID=3469 RepID=UPI000E6F7347|nr:uncharacterized protein LOC113311627 [Papaver somniferum]
MSSKKERQLRKRNRKQKGKSIADSDIVWVQDKEHEFANIRQLVGSGVASRHLSNHPKRVLLPKLRGLHINFSKCSIFGVAGAVNLAPMARILGCNPEVLPSSYLGLPLEDSLMGAQKWESIIERIKNRLPFWKRSSLSKAGKLTLIKSVLLSILIYMLSLFIAPPKVVKAIEKVIRDFLWDASDNKKGYHYVKWKTCCLPLKAGG